MAAVTNEVFSASEGKDTCEIEATVVTGFEPQAKEEILEKLHVPSTSSRGKVNFHIAVSESKKVLELSSIDNATVILKHYTSFQFADNVDDVMKQFRALIPEIDWELGLKVWHQFFSFPHPISAHPICKQDDATSKVQASVDSGSQDCQQEEQAPPETNQPADDGNKQAQNDGHNNVDTSVEDASKSSQSACEEPEPKRLRETSWNPDLPAFRVTCYRSGKHIFQSPDAAAHFGGEINNYFGWNVSMKKFDIEVILNIEQDHVYVSLALTKQSLHRRNLTSFGPTTLRPTIAYNMLRFSRIKDGEVVCDPMCGGGSIPIEAVLNWPNAVHLCGDIHDQACPRTKANIDALNEKRLKTGLFDKHISPNLFHFSKSLPLTVFKWDACKLPLKNESVDLFITDLPFGKRSGSKVRNCHLYPKVLMEMARVCRPETGRACLLTEDKKNLVKSLIPIESLWRRGPTIAINIGGLAAGIFLLHRTTRKYMTKDELSKDRQLRDEYRQQKQIKYQEKHQQLQQAEEDSSNTHSQLI